MPVSDALPLGPDDVWLTAHNPASRRLAPAENLARNRCLLQRVGRLGWRAGHTIDPAGRWPREDGLWLARPGVALVRGLLAEFGQNACVRLDEQRTLRLVFRQDQNTLCVVRT